MSGRFPARVERRHAAARLGRRSSLQVPGNAGRTRNGVTKVAVRTEFRIQVFGFSFSSTNFPSLLKSCISTGLPMLQLMQGSLKGPP